MHRLRLLSLDFDGTLVGPWTETEARICPDLMFCLNTLRQRGVMLALNTGRTLPLVEQALEFFPFRPDFALTTEREVFRWQAEQWHDFGDWNARCRVAHSAWHTALAPILLDISRLVEDTTEARLYYEEGRFSGIVARNEAEMDRIQETLEDCQRRFPLFSFQRNSIYVRFCQTGYDKGSALGELQRLLGIEAAHTFAAGDNYNDLPMLVPERARWLACPANSIDEVKSAVTAHAGFVAAQQGGTGTAEALHFYFPELLRA